MAPSSAGARQLASQKLLRISLAPHAGGMVSNHPVSFHPQSYFLQLIFQKSQSHRAEFCSHRAVRGPSQLSGVTSRGVPLSQALNSPFYRSDLSLHQGDVVGVTLAASIRAAAQKGPAVKMPYVICPPSQQLLHFLSPVKFRLCKTTWIIMFPCIYSFFSYS